MVKESFQLQKRLTKNSKNYFFPKFSNDLKIVSRHCGGHYNIKIKHFEDFSGGGAPGAHPPMSNSVKKTKSKILQEIKVLPTTIQDDKFNLAL